MDGLAAKEALIAQLFHTHSHALPDLYDACLSASPHAQDWLDEATLFRFYRKHKFDLEATTTAVSKTTHWRDAQSFTSHQAVPGMFFTHQAMQDHFGRPVLLVRLCQCTGEQNVKQAVIGALEAMRKMMANLHTAEEPILQCAVLIDLRDAGVRNVPLDLAPFLLDLLKSHFPGSIASIFILNYTWLHSGVWTVVKSFLPATALERIHFPSSSQPLSTFFPMSNILVEHGGDLNPDLYMLSYPSKEKEESDGEDEDEFHSAMPSRTASHTQLHLATSPLPSTRHLTVLQQHSKSTAQIDPRSIPSTQIQVDPTLPLPKRLLVQILLSIAHYVERPAVPTKETEVHWSTRERMRRTLLGVSLLIVARSAWAGKVSEVMVRMGRKVLEVFMRVMRGRMSGIWLRLMRQNRLLGR